MIIMIMMIMMIMNDYDDKKLDDFTVPFVYLSEILAPTYIHN